MPFDYSGHTVQLRRHIGLMSSHLGTVEVEHPQKIVLVYLPDMDTWRQAGYLSDVAGAPLLWLPDVKEEAPPQLVEHVESEAERLKAAGEFVDPPPMA